MPYNVKKQKCKQSDGDAGNYVVQKKMAGKWKKSSCHSSKDNAESSIRARGMNEDDDIETESLYKESIIMKITQKQLRKIINEELLREWGQEVETGSPLITFARAYMGLGTSIAAQVDAVVGAYINSGNLSEEFAETVYEQNGNAIDMAMDKIGRVLRFGDLGDEGEMILEALTAAQNIFNEGDEEVEADARSAGDL